MAMSIRNILCEVGVTAIGLSSAVHAAQPLETESARVLPPGGAQFEGSVEYQTSSEGTETAVPLLIKYGLPYRLELSIEPVAYASIDPDAGDQAAGAGDVETTLKWVAIPERGGRWGLGLAAEIKWPTAKDRLIGTGKTDFRGFAVVSRHIEDWDLHANLGYTFIGSPRSVPLDNVIDAAVAAEYRWSEKLTWVVEVIGNTSATRESPDGVTLSAPGGENALAPEAAGEELVGLIGARYHLRPNVALALGVTYDNNDAFLIRPGINITW